MTDDADLMSDLGGSQEAFDVQMRGYSRKQVNQFVTKSRSQIRDLHERLSRSVEEAERLGLELSATRQGLGSKPVHEQVSEQVSHVLQLADEEAKAQRSQTQDEIATLREETEREVGRFQAEAREQAERMLAAAQEQAQNAITAARAEAEKMHNSARAQSERAVSEAANEAKATLAAAKAQTKQMLDAATLRASAIDDGAERRLSLLASRHTEIMRRLAEVRDVVTTLVASEEARGSLEEGGAKPMAVAPGSGEGTPSGDRSAASSPDGQLLPTAQAPGRGGRRDAAGP